MGTLKTCNLTIQLLHFPNFIVRDVEKKCKWQQRTAQDMYLRHFDLILHRITWNSDDIIEMCQIHNIQCEVVSILNFEVNGHH